MKKNGLETDRRKKMKFNRDKSTTVPKADAGNHGYASEEKTSRSGIQR